MFHYFTVLIFFPEEKSSSGKSYLSLDFESFHLCLTNIIIITSSNRRLKSVFEF